MRYVTSHERIGMEKGRQQGLLQGIEQGLQQGLERGMQQGLQQGLHQGRLKSAQEAVLDTLSIRFEQVPDAVEFAINALDRLLLLRQLHRTAGTIESLEAFEKTLKTLNAKP